MKFGWDKDKAEKNLAKHGVSFDETLVLFTSELPVLEIYDLEHSEFEDRYKSIGPIERGLILVVWTERHDDVIRIISAWPATKHEELLYQEFLEEQND